MWPVLLVVTHTGAWCCTYTMEMIFLLLSLPFVLSKTLFFLQNIFKFEIKVNKKTTTDNTCIDNVWLRWITFLLLQHMIHVYQTTTWITPNSTEVPCSNRSPRTRSCVTVIFKRVIGGLNSWRSYTPFLKLAYINKYTCTKERSIFEKFYFSFFVCLYMLLFLDRLACF